MFERNANRTLGWMGIQRGHKARPLEWIVEKSVLLVSLSTILMILLIFLFIGREAMPILLGRMDSSHAIEAIPPEKMHTLSRQKLQAYLELDDAEFARMKEDDFKVLMEIKAEEKKEAPTDKDSAANTTDWKYLVKPHQWTGYSTPEYIWHPVSGIKKYNI